MKTHHTLVPTKNIPLYVPSARKEIRDPEIPQYCGLNNWLNSIHDVFQPNTWSEPDQPIVKEHCKVSKDDQPVMGHFRTTHKFFSLIFIFLVFCGCKKDVPEKRVTDSIFGEYFYNPPSSGDFWSDLFNGTTIGIFSVNATYIKIINSPLSFYGSGALVFDSVRMSSSTSFTINQIISDQQSANGFSRASGNGNFGKKLLSYNILIERNGLIGNTSIVVVNAVKTKD